MPTSEKSSNKAKTKFDCGHWALMARQNDQCNPGGRYATCHAAWLFGVVCVYINNFDQINCLLSETVAIAVLANWRFPPVIGAEDAFLECITVKAEILLFEHHNWKLTFFPTTLRKSPPCCRLLLKLQQCRCTAPLASSSRTEFFTISSRLQPCGVLCSVT